MRCFFCSILIGSFALMLCSDLALAETEIESEIIVEIEQVETLLKRDDVLFVDNRPAFKYQQGHLRGAINLPFFVEGDSSNIMTKENLLEEIGDKRVVVFYCTGVLRAYHALRQAQSWGVKVKMYWYILPTLEFAACAEQVEAEGNLSVE